jgi:hypothetical protein
VMVRPLPEDPRYSWLELHNQNGADVDISNWSIIGSVSFRFPEGTIIPGWGHLIVAASPATLAGMGIGGAIGPWEGAFEERKERLDLLDNNLRFMDTLDFSRGGKWPAGADGSGMSLAKIDPDGASEPAEGWTWSAQVGGTPGKANFGGDDGPNVTYPAGLVSWWSFDEASGRALDPVGANDGTPGTGARRAAGVVGSGAFSFDGTTNAFLNVGVGVGNNYSCRTGFAIEALIAPGWSGTSGDADEIFRKDDGGNGILFGFLNDGENGSANPPAGPGPVLAFGLNVGGEYTRLVLLLDGAGGRPSLASLKDGSPHHVAATYDGATGLKAIWVDGVRAAEVSLAPGAAVASGGTIAAYIGNKVGRGEAFTGTIDEVCFWSRALTADEVASHSSRGRAGEIYFSGSEPVVDPLSLRLALNETLIGPTGNWIEIASGETEAVSLTGLVLAQGTGAAEKVLAGSIPAGGFLAFDAAALGFALVPGEKLFLFAPGRTSLIDAVELEAGNRGRRPDVVGRWLAPDRGTPGDANSFVLHEDVVIDEILYHHRPLADGTTFVESEESWIELHNRSAAAVDLTGWKIEGGIEFDFEDGTVIGPGGYLVVAADRDALELLHPGIAIAGNYRKRLSHRSDRIVLEDAARNPADEVVYFDGGRWPGEPDGGGSSLELRDPRADNSVAEAWAASDESGRSSWRTYSYRGTAAADRGPTQWNEFCFGLMDDGQVLIDDLSVIEAPDGAKVQFLQNGDFEAGAAHWRLLGNHRRSEVIVDPSNPSNHVLRLVATGGTEHMHNHIEGTFASSRRVTNGRVYEISFRARRLSGSNMLHTRLYFNRVSHVTYLDVPAACGTPGAANSRLEANIGPTYKSFGHAPVVPKASEKVAVTVAAADPDGVASVELLWSVNGGAWQTAAMTAGGGRWSGEIPGQAASATIQFYVRGTDGRGAVSTFPAKGADSRALYRVQDGQAILGKVHNFRIIMTSADATFLHTQTNVMSNDYLGATVVYDEAKAFYDAGVHLKGSERGRGVDQRVGFHVRLGPDQPFRGVHRKVEVDRSGGWRWGGQFGQDEIVIKHIVNHAGGIPGMYDDVIRVIAPRPTHTSPALLMMAAFGDEYLDSQYANGSEGISYNYELIYYPTTTSGGTEGLKLPQPDNVTGVDVSDLGSDEEAYRWFFTAQNNAARDDYAKLIALCKAFSLPSSTLDAGTKAILDVNEWMRTFTIYSLCMVSDTYTQGNFHNNIYWTRPEDGKVLVFPWDMDFSFVRGTSSSLWGDSNLARIIAIPGNQRLFYRHLKDIIDTTFNPTYMARWVTHYGSLANWDYSVLTSDISARRTFVLGRLPAAAPFAITTSGGNDFTVDAATVVIDGTGSYDVETIVVPTIEAALPLTWPGISAWRTTVPLDFGPNHLTFFALDTEGTPLGSDSITITSTVGAPRPRIETVAPARAKAGASVKVTGTGFQTGIQVFFGSTLAPAVDFQPGADPLSLNAQVPDLPPGDAPITIRNPDGRVSVPAAFEVVGLEFVRGDANLDGKLELPDGIVILFYLFEGQSVGCLEALDSNDSRTINVTDAIYVLRYLFAGGTQPSAPFPAAGSDPDPASTLGCEQGI